MKYREAVYEQVLDMYPEGLSAREIAEEIGSSIGSVEATIYKYKLNKDPVNREVHQRMRIKKLIAEYEEEFKQRFLAP